MATTTGTTREQVAHSIDYIGQSKGLYRFNNESVVDFRKRVLDVWVHKANASTVGYIYGSARQLGTPARQIGVIAPVVSVAAPSPGVLVTNSRIHFYTDFTSSTVEESLDIASDFPRPDITLASYVEDIYNWVDTSSNWTWESEPSADDRLLKSKYIVPTQSYSVFTQEATLRTGINRMSHQVVSGTVVSNSTLVLNEVASLGDLAERGDYYIDNTNSLIYVFDDGSGEVASVNYAYYEMRIYLDWAPVCVQNLSDEEFFNSMFDLEKSEDNTGYTNVRYSKELAMLIIKAWQLDGTYWFARDTNDTPVDIREEYLVSDTLTDDLDTYFLDVQENLRQLIQEV